jgi:N-acyl-D-amino-acid deacylase
MVEAARANGQEVWLDQYPYTASSTTMNTLLPDWVLEKGGDEAKTILRDPEQVKKVLSEMRQLHEVTRLRKDMSFAVVTSAQNHPEYSGLSIKQIAQMKKYWKENPQGAELIGSSTTKPADAPAKTGNPWDIVEVTMEDQYRAVIDIYLDGGAGGVFHTMDETEVKNILANPLVGIASDSGVRVFGSGMPHPRGYGTNSRVLGRYVRELKVITLEDAIRKMTSQPATAFRMEGRGTIRVGNFADLVIFDPQTVIDQSTFDKPHQYPLGIDTVIVNGTAVFEDGKMTGTKPGDAIYGPGKK